MQGSLLQYLRQDPPRSFRGSDCELILCFQSGTSASFQERRKRKQSGQFLGKRKEDNSSRAFESILGQEVWVSVSQYRAISKLETSEAFLFPALCKHAFGGHRFYFIYPHKTGLIPILMISYTVCPPSQRTHKHSKVLWGTVCKMYNVNTFNSAGAEWLFHSTGLLMHSRLKRKLLQMMDM